MKIKNTTTTTTAAATTAAATTDHQKWEAILSALKKLLHKQSQDIQSLLHHRHLLQNCILSQRDTWQNDNRLLHDIILQLKRELVTCELEKSCEIAKAEFRLSSKHRDSVVDRVKLEYAQCDLEDLNAWFDILSRRCHDKEVSSLNALKDGFGHQSKLEKEVALLKRENEKLSIKYKSDTSALQDKYNFVWNQFEEMEGNYSNQLQMKNDEIIGANEKIRILIADMEQIQSANNKKEEEVTNLKDEVNKKDEEIIRLSKELKLVQSKITGGSQDPSTSVAKSKKIRGNRHGPGLEEDATNAQLQATISTLRTKLSELQNESDKKCKENSKLSKELKLLRSERSTVMPVLRRCTNEPSSSRSTGRGYDKGRGIVAKEEQASLAQLEATIATLRVRISELEAEKNQKNGEVSTSSRELESLFKGAADTPFLKRCTTQPPSSRLRGSRNGKEQNGVALSGKTSSVGVDSEQGSKRSKRKQDGPVSVEDTPKLFTSQFKIPKLRSQSPHGR